LARTSAALTQRTEGQAVVAMEVRATALQKFGTHLLAVTPSDSLRTWLVGETALAATPKRSGGVAANSASASPLPQPLRRSVVVIHALHRLLLTHPQRLRRTDQDAQRTTDA